MRTAPFALLVACMLFAKSAHADVAGSVSSVVSILPVTAGAASQRAGAGRGRVPEASGIVVGRDGLIATARHVIEAVKRIEVRLVDGRVLPARLIGQDAATDIALIKVDTALEPIRFAPAPRIADRVCAIGNAYGLDLSVTCGVVSALHVSHAGFNAIEDFVQTDAAANPGSSGGALVDTQGRLVGMMSAIFAAKADTNIGVNFAVSTRLLSRVIDDLKDDGRVDFISAGWRLTPLARGELSRGPGARVADLWPDGPAGRAGLATGDIIRRIGDRRVRSPKAALAALALYRRGETVPVTYERGGTERRAALTFPQSQSDTPPQSANETNEPDRDADCPYPANVCRVRQAVFPIESYDPLASAVRIANDLLVTNRHAVGAQQTAVVFTPDGPKTAQVLPSTYTGDLALLKVDGLPADGLIVDLSAARKTQDQSTPHFVVGADVARKEVRVFRPGLVLRPPAKDAPLGRLHVSSQMQPGVSGGALVDADGRLVGIAVGGGEGRNEAMPPTHIQVLLTGRADANAAEVQRALGSALETCAAALERAEQRRGRQTVPAETIASIRTACQVSQNLGQYLRAARVLAFARDLDASVTLAQAAVTQVPNSVNARISYLVALQLARRFKDMLPHARWLMRELPDDPQALRFAIQSGVWAGEPSLAEAAFERLKTINPQQAQAARRFIDRPPPTPQPR